jgi:hypothetical protein
MYLKHLPLDVARAALISLLSMPILAQDWPDFSGTWSDPPPRAEDAFCHIGCVIEAREYLTSLVEDIAYIDLAFPQLYNLASDYQDQELVPSYMVDEVYEKRMAEGAHRDLALICDPWGLVRTSLAPHAMKLDQYEDHISMLTAEWAVSRYIYMDGRDFPKELEHTKYGYSIGHYEGDQLVIETDGLIADTWGHGGFTHSSQAKVTERFTRIDDRLEVEVTLTDPLTFKQPIRMARAWAWAPGEKIYPYDSCVIPEL